MTDQSQITNEQALKEKLKQKMGGSKLLKRKTDRPEDTATTLEDLTKDAKKQKRSDEGELQTQNSQSFGNEEKHTILNENIILEKNSPKNSPVIISSFNIPN